MCRDRHKESIEDKVWATSQVLAIPAVAALNNTEKTIIVQAIWLTDAESVSVGAIAPTT